MRKDSLAFLHQLLDTPSPSGFEQRVQAVVREYASPFADRITTDVHGNVAAMVNPEGSPRILLAGHCDQIGFMVQHIDDNGFISFAGIGGHDVSVLIGQNVTVWGPHGGLPGVIARKAIHLLSSDERGKVPEMHELWIDVGAHDKAEVEERVRIGDAVTFRVGMTELRNGNVSGPGMDNKVGVWTVVEALRLASERPLEACVYAVSTVQEEIGLRGATTAAFGIDPLVGIAVDVHHATDTPGMDLKQHGSVKLGRGPVLVRGTDVNPRVYERLLEAAACSNIDVQIAAGPKPTGTDANAIQISRAGVAGGLVKVPNRYMHSTVEVVNLDDVANSAKLLAAFVGGVTRDADFTP